MFEKEHNITGRHRRHVSSFSHWHTCVGCCGSHGDRSTGSCFTTILQNVYVSRFVLARNYWTGTCSERVNILVSNPVSFAILSMVHPYVCFSHYIYIYTHITQNFDSKCLPLLRQWVYTIEQLVEVTLLKNWDTCALQNGANLYQPRWYKVVRWGSVKLASLMKKGENSIYIAQCGSGYRRSFSTVFTCIHAENYL